MCYGQTDVPLRETFEQEAAEVARKLEGACFDKVFTSPLSRCVRLAEYCGYGDATRDERLKELNFGRWEMQMFEQIKDPGLQRWFDDYFNIPAPEGESFKMQLERLSAFFDELRQCDYDHVGIFAHGGILTCAQLYSGDITLDTAFSILPPYGGVVDIHLTRRVNAVELLSKYYDTGSEAYRIVRAHGEDVARKALDIARRHPEMKLDMAFLEEAAMLHDIGIFRCHAPEIDCHGEADYICHGYLGADLLHREGYPRHAGVCERHTGAGISCEEIVARNLPLPHRDMIPLSQEEELICFADKFFSKTHLGQEKPIEKILSGLSKYGNDSLVRFQDWCKRFYAILLLLLFAGCWSLQAQEAEEAALPPDTAAAAGPQNGLSATVYYQAADSIIMTAGNWAYLYGQGNVKYEQIQLDSEIIEMNLDSSLVYARFGRDSIGEPFGYPLFKDGGQEYESKTMRYNFKSEKGYITDVITQQGEGFVTSAQTKKLDNDILNMAGGRYTTCDDHDHPHFYIQMSKAKVYPGKRIITGPVHLVIEDVPLPLWLPFAFFPFSDTYSSGILFPTFGEESSRGFYIRDGGYYFAFNDYIDVALTGEYYTKGSWGVNLHSTNKRRYRYNRNINASYLVTKLGDVGLPDYSLTKDFKLTLSHTQDAKANPYRTLSASVNFSTSGYEKNNVQGYYTPTATQNTKSSTVNITQRFPNNPLSLSANMSVNQVARDTSLAVTLPDITISMSRIFPFKRKQIVGSERWYEKISMSYSGSLRNSITAKEYDFFQANIIRDWKNAMQHQIPVSATFNLFNYINISPSVNYRERWYTKKVEQAYDAQNSRMAPSDTTYGFYRVYDYNTSVSASTTFYGFFQPLSFVPLVKMIRHRMDVSVSAGFTPDFSDRKYGYYKTYNYLDNQGQEHSLNYSPFEGSMFGVPGRGQQGTLSFSIDNNIEAKIKSNRDSIGESKISLIDKLSFNMSHNLIADSFKWSDLSVGLRLKFSKSYALNLNGVFDTYTYRVNTAADGRQSYARQNIMRIQAGKGLGRLRSTGTSFSYTLNNETVKKSFQRLQALFGAGEPPAEEPPAEDPEETPAGTLDEFGEIRSLVPEQGGGRLRRTQTEASGETDDNGYWINGIPWSFSVNYSLTLGYGDFNYQKKEFDYRITNALSFSGNIQPTKNWQFNFNGTYDFETKKISYLTCNVSRNLHCFTMTASFRPIGNAKSYTFSIAVSSSLLKDLKYDRRSNYRDGQKWY
jgi:broad specificity phosphatase PhoE/HD superfamily phosphodiesterase